MKSHINTAIQKLYEIFSTNILVCGPLPSTLNIELYQSNGYVQLCISFFFLIDNYAYQIIKHSFKRHKAQMPLKTLRHKEHLRCRLL